MENKLSMTDTVVLLQAGTPGGCLTLYCDRSAELQRYQVNLTDRSALVLGDAVGSQHDSGVTNSIEDAFSLLDRYPWHQFTPHVIHPDVQSFVWAIINDRFDRDLVTSSAMVQWKRCCAVAGVDAGPSSTGQYSGINPTRPSPGTNVISISGRSIDRKGNSHSIIGDSLGPTPLSLPDIVWEDIEHFRRAVECGLAEISHDGSYRIRSDCADGISSHSQPDGGRSVPSIQAPEHIIGLAAMARLHLDFGWPKECLIGYPHRSSFSIVASVLPKSNSAHIACDVRKTADELARLVADVRILCRKRPLISRQASGEEGCSARRWLETFRRNRPALFWVLGPSATRILYQLSYQGACIQLNKVPDPASCLNYPGTRCVISGWRSA